MSICALFALFLRAALKNNNNNNNKNTIKVLTFSRNFSGCLMFPISILVKFPIKNIPFSLLPTETYICHDVNYYLNSKSIYFISQRLFRISEEHCMWVDEERRSSEDWQCDGKGGIRHAHWSDRDRQSPLLQKKGVFFSLVNFKNNSKRCYMEQHTLKLKVK